MRSARHQPGEVRHVDEEKGVDPASDRGHPFEIEDARIRAVAGEQHLGPHLFRLSLQHVVIDPLRVRIDPIGHEVVELAREIDGTAVAEVTAVAQVHAQHGVPRIEHRRIDGVVGRRAAVGLDVGVLGIEESLRPLDGERLDPIDVLAAAVIALARVAFGVFVVEQ